MSGDPINKGYLMDKDITKFVYEDFITFQEDEQKAIKKSVLEKENTISMPKEYLQDLEIVGDEEKINQNIAEVQEGLDEAVEEVDVPEPKDKYQEGYDAAKAELEPLLEKKNLKLIQILLNLNTFCTHVPH